MGDFVTKFPAESFLRQKWKVYLTFESEGNILMESKLYILEENEEKQIGGNRKERGIRQEELVRALEVSRQTISSLENGRYNPSILLAFKIARYFDMAIEDIFIYEEGTE